jgi:hypothetical protein
MSLKQECIDIINLITEPLKKDEYDLYEIETDSIRDICELSGKDVTYGDCFDCEHYGDCTYKKRVKVDVSFWDYADFQRNYVFAKKPSVSKGICYINNRKQLMAEMSQFRKEIEQYKDYYAEFGEKYNDFMEYAKEFGEKLRQEYSFFENIDTDILPIVFHTDFAKDNEGKTDYETKGNFVSRGKQNVINTYYCMEDIERTKQNIRHELLHYFLYMSDMKYLDDDAIFHYLCGIYDAHAYKEMGEEEQGLYDKLVFVIPELEKKCKELNCKDGAFNANRDVVMMASGSNRESFHNKELYDHGIRILNMVYKVKPIDVKEDTSS